jgi:hypothetical protein
MTLPITWMMTGQNNAEKEGRLLQETEGYDQEGISSDSSKRSHFGVLRFLSWHRKAKLSLQDPGPPDFIDVEKAEANSLSPVELPHGEQKFDRFEERIIDHLIGDGSGCSGTSRN